MDVSLVPMRPRGHPSRLYSELAMIQHYRGELNNAVTSSVMQSPESSSRDGDQSEDHPADFESDRPIMKLAVPKIESEQDSQPSDEAMEDEESLHWSVEMAAVNQAILSLTGQQPIEVAPTADRPEGAEGATHHSLNTPPPPASGEMS